MLRELVELGYEALPEVAGRGEFARRGGIVDVFPAGQPLPVRIEWFGDEIESLRAFDPADQRGVRPVDQITLLPASEFLLGESPGPRLTSDLGTAANRLPAELAADLARLEQGQLGDAAEVWAGHLAPATGARPPRRRGLAARRAGDVAASADFLWTQADERRAELERAGALPKTLARMRTSRARDWKRRLDRGADARADLGVARSTARRRAATRSAGTSRSLPPTPIGDLADDGRPLAARRPARRARVATSRRASSEILARGRHRRRAHSRSAPRRRRRAVWR